MAKVEIFGAYVWGMELRRILEDSGTEVVGYRDEDTSKIGSAFDGLPVRALDPCLSPLGADIGLVSAVGSVEARRRAVALFGEAAFPSFVHPSAIRRDPSELGVGSVICPRAVLAVSSVVGRHCRVNYDTLVSEDCVIDDFATLAPRTVLGGNVHIGAGAFIGMGAIIAPNIRIGAGAIVAIGAVVNRDVPDNYLASGNPARAIPRMRDA